MLYVAPLILVLGQLLAVPCISVATLASWPSRVTVKYSGLVFDSHTCRLTCCLARLCTVHASSCDLDLVLHVCWRKVRHSRCSRIIEQTAVAVWESLVIYAERNCICFNWKRTFSSMQWIFGQQNPNLYNTVFDTEPDSGVELSIIHQNRVHLLSPSLEASPTNAVCASTPER